MAVIEDTYSRHAALLAERFQAQLDRSHEICDLLEALADDLPRRSMAIWRAAKLQCQNVLTEHVALGDGQIIPLLQRAKATVDQRNVVLRFQSEYSALASRLDDLDDLLFDALATDRTGIGPEALGYALRSHFDALRRTIGWERDVLLPMVARSGAAATP